MSQNISEEEIDELFGEEEQVRQPDQDEKNGGEDDEFGNRDSGDRDSGNEDLGLGQDSDDSDGDGYGEEKEMQKIDISIPRHAILLKTDGDVHMIKMPVFLNVDAHPFDAGEFKEKVIQNAAEREGTTMDAKQMQNDLIAEKLLNENTIRWRYSNSGNDEIIKQSNAHFIQWNDGSISIKIGHEMFDYKELPIKDNLLVRSHDDHEILQVDSVINKLTNLIPSSTFTSTHRKLTQAVKNIQRKDKILNTITDNDPLLKQKLADENERKSLKMKRQLELKRRLQEDKLERSAPSLERGSYEPSYERFEKTYADEYDEEDDFIANDDGEEEGEEEEEEEEEEDDNDAEREEEEFERGAERLKNLKNEGAFKYDKPKSESIETPQEEEPETQEENGQSRKKRRIIDSEDED